MRDTRLRETRLRSSKRQEVNEKASVRFLVSFTTKLIIKSDTF